MIDWARPLKEALARYFFGRDAFISYSHRDATAYAQALVLAAQAKFIADHPVSKGRAPQISFYLDSWLAAPSTQLSGPLVRHLARSRILIVICSKHAVCSQNVKDEITLFSAAVQPRRPIVPIDVAGNYERFQSDAQLADKLKGLAAESEALENLQQANPSPAVVTRVVKAIDFTTQEQRLQRAVSRSASVLALVVIAAASIGYWSFSRVKTADAQVAVKELAMRGAELGRGQAEERAKKARDDQRDAEAKKRTAEALATAAKQSAERQQAMATALRLANDAEIAFTTGNDAVARGVVSAVQAGSAADVAKLRLVAVDGALRHALQRLSTRRDAQSIGYAAHAAAFSPDGLRLAISVPLGQGAEEVQTMVVGSKGNQVGAVPNGTVGSARTGLLAISNDDRCVAVSAKSAAGHVVRVRRHVDQEWDLEVPSEAQRVVAALSPDCRFAVLGYQTSQLDSDNLHPGEAELWDVRNKDRVRTLDTGGSTGTLEFHSVSFSAGGHWLVVAGAYAGRLGRPAGRALVWQVGKGEDPVAESFERIRDYSAQVVSAEPFEDAIISDDGLELVTSTKREVLVWRRSGRKESFGVKTVLPLAGPIAGITFPAIETTSALLILRQRRSAMSELELWDLDGFGELLLNRGYNHITRAGFIGSGASLQVRVDEGGDTTHIWRVQDGQLIKRFDPLPPSPEEPDQDEPYQPERRVPKWAPKPRPCGDRTSIRAGRPLVLEPAKSQDITPIPFQRFAHATRFESSASCKFFAAGNERGDLLVLERASSAALRTQLSFEITALAFSADEHYLAAGDGNGLAVVYDLPALTEIARLENRAPVRVLDFSPDARYLLAATATGFHVWQLQLNDLIAEACRRLELFGTRCSTLTMQRPSLSP